MVLSALSFCKQQKWHPSSSKNSQILCESPHAHLDPVQQSGIFVPSIDHGIMYGKDIMAIMGSMYSFLSGCAVSTKPEKVEGITGAEMQEEEMEPEVEALVGPEGEALRLTSIAMVYSPPHCLTALCFFSASISAMVPWQFFLY